MSFYQIHVDSSKESDIDKKKEQSKTSIKLLVEKKVTIDSNQSLDTLVNIFF